MRSPAPALIPHPHPSPSISVGHPTSLWLGGMVAPPPDPNHPPPPPNTVGESRSLGMGDENCVWRGGFFRSSPTPSKWQFIQKHRGGDYHTFLFDFPTSPTVLSCITCILLRCLSSLPALSCPAKKMKTRHKKKRSCERKGQSLKILCEFHIDAIKEHIKVFLLGLACKKKCIVCSRRRHISMFGAYSPSVPN